MINKYLIVQMKFINILKKMGYNDGDRLFLKKKTKSAFILFISNIFENNENKHVTLTYLRVRDLTYIYAGRLKSEEEYRKLAKIMAHSREEQLRYRKIIDDQTYQDQDNQNQDESSTHIFYSSIPLSIPSSTFSSTFPSSTSSSLPVSSTSSTSTSSSIPS